MSRKSLWFKKFSFLMSLCILVTSIFSVTVVNGLAAQKGFKVFGNRLYDASGNVFMMRGINYPYTYFKDDITSVISAIVRKTGANTVRIGLGDGLVREYTDANTVKKVISVCEEYHLCVVLDVIVDESKNDSIDTLNKAVDYWIDIKDALIGKESTVIVNIANAWCGNQDGAFWAKSYAEAIPRLRAAGIHNTIMVDAAGWAENAKSIHDYGKDVFYSDPDRNTMFSIHMYEYAGKDAETVIKNIDGVLNQGLTLCIGEFVNRIRDIDVDEKTIMSYAQEKGVSWLAWSWYGNPDQVKYLDISTDWTGSNLTEWGKIVVDGPNGIKQAAHTVSPTPYVIPKPTIGKKIKIQLTSNNYDYVYYYFNKVTDTAEGSNINLTTRANVENAEVFSIEDGGNGAVFLKAISPEGNVDGYLSVDSENRVVINTSLTPGNTEKFELYSQTGSGYFNLKSIYNGKFVCADVFSGYSVTADRDIADVWETFYADILPYAIPSSTTTIPLPTTMPSAENRPPTPSVKRTPGPTELDVIYTIGGNIIAENINDKIIDLNNCTIEFLGTGMSQTGGDFQFNTCYSCGKLRISRPGYLAREVQIEKFIYGGKKSVELYAGDINQDNAINISDIMEVAQCFNSEQGDKKFNKICDFNEDTVINIVDIIIVASHFNTISSDYKKLSDNLSTSERNLEFTVEPAKEISKDSASIKGAIYNMSDLRCITPVWIEYWEESSPLNVNMTSSDTIFYYPDFIARTITGLKPGTTYKYRVNSGMGSSEIKSFSTLKDKIETRMSISDTHPYVHSVVVSVKLADSAGNPIENKKILCNGMETVTGANGEAVFDINVAAQEDYGNPYLDVKASFDGDDEYLKCTAEKRITLNSQPITMQYEEITGYSALKLDEFLIQNNGQFNQWFRYIWDHNPIPQREISDQEFNDCIVVGVVKPMSQPTWDRLTLEKIIYSGGRYIVRYNYSPDPAPEILLSQGIYRMALVKKLPFTQVDFYANGTLVKTISP